MKGEDESLRYHLAVCVGKGCQLDEVRSGLQERSQELVYFFPSANYFPTLVR